MINYNRLGYESKRDLTHFYFKNGETDKYKTASRRLS